MSASAIAKRYAKALVQIGAEEEAVDRYYSELTGFESMLAANAGLTVFLSNPAYGIEEKREVLRELTGKLGLSTTMQNFLLLLLDRSRLYCLSQITACYGSLADELSGVIRPVVISAEPLAESQAEQIKEALMRQTGKKVLLKLEVDSSLIGGVVTRIGDKIYDGSVKTQLARIEDTLQKG